jgi:hypothetical protein
MQDDLAAAGDEDGRRAQFAGLYLCLQNGRGGFEARGRHAGAASGTGTQLRVAADSEQDKKANDETHAR